MPCDVVCISATDGSLGRQVARTVAGALGFRLVDEGIVLQAAREAGVEPRVVADAELRKPLVARLLDRLADAGQGTAPALGAWVPTTEEEAQAPRGEALRHLVTAAVEETADRGSAVILGHAASIALRRRPEVLRVLVTAAEETRAQRLAVERVVDEAAARRLLAEADAGRRSYLKRFYGVAAEEPTQYDVVVSTDRLDAESAAAVVVAAARA